MWFVIKPTALTLLLLCLIGCKEKQHVSLLPRGNKFLGEFNIGTSNQLSAIVKTPDAAQTFFSIAFPEVQLGDAVSTSNLLQSLRGMVLEISAEDKSPAPGQTRRALIRFHDLDQIGNWYAPCVSFALKPSCFGLTNRLDLIHVPKQADRFFLPDHTYTIQISVVQAATARIPTRVYIDYWGIKDTGVEQHVSTNTGTAEP
jgi:hypothetical protein